MRVLLKRLIALPALLVALAMLLTIGNGGGAAASRPTLGAGNSAPAAASASKLYGRLGQAAAAAQASTRMRVIVHLRDQADLSTWPTNNRPGAIRALHAVADRSQPAVKQFLAGPQMAANIYQNYWIFNGFALEAPLSTIQALAARDDVAYIIEDGYFTLPKDETVAQAPADPTNNWNIYQVNAPQVWALGYDGTGRTLANLDTGVDGTHQALASRWRGIQPGYSPADSWLDPFGYSPNFPTATGPHGTHTMGTIAGSYGSPSGPGEIGQAKGAFWMACRIYDTTGKGPFSYMHACFQFMADPDGNPATNDQPDAVGNSWGDSYSESFPDLEWWPDIVAWRAAGVIPVFSNANSGPAPGTVNEPGSYPISIGVGAIDINRNIAGFSSRGPAENRPPWNDPRNWDRSDWNLIKPEVVAPGVNVRSSIPGNQYANYSGTSMASPHITGLAGLLRQIRPDLTINEFYNIIIDTSFYSPTWGIRPNNNYGWGEIDDYAAAIYVRDAGAIMGAITDPACAAPVAGAEVHVYDNTPGSRAAGVGIRKIVSDNTGSYRTILAAGQYTVTVSAPGFYGISFTTSVMSTTTSTLPIALNRMATGTVTGTVSDGTNPVAGVLVSVDGLPNIYTTTDAQGVYTMTNVPAGTFTVHAEKCSYTGDVANITVTYPNTTSHNFTLGSPSVLLADDFESGTLNNWVVAGGSPTTGEWYTSTLRTTSGIYAARASIFNSPIYTGTLDTTMTSATAHDGSNADRVWLSFNLYDSAESEYDLFRAEVSSDGGTTWTTAYGEASPVHGWQAICLDITQFKSANMKIRFHFKTDSSNWNGQSFEGPSVDDVRFTASMASGSATATPLPALTPTPGTPVPCIPLEATPTPTIAPSSTPTTAPSSTPTAPPGSTATATAPPSTATVPPGTTNTPTTQPASTATATVPPGSTATATATACTISFSDVHMSDYFYVPVQYLYCHGVISGYSDGTFRPYNPTTRSQMVKIVVLGFTKPIITPAGGAYSFTDVTPANPFYSVVETAAADGIVSGYNCGAAPAGPCDSQHRPYFLPYNYVTRGQLSKIDVIAAGWTLYNPPVGHFTDVIPGSTFYTVIETAYCHGVIGGYSDRTFRPYNNAIRGQIAKIVYLSIVNPPTSCGATP
ncbi:MAG: S8 family serine peptidase [Chloroflexia bacterium]